LNDFIFFFKTDSAVYLQLSNGQTSYHTYITLLHYVVIYRWS